jgi:LacI family gluconate utilization system Gnt-I transcriptional repressor
MPEPRMMPPRGRAVTMATIGRLAGVSQVTVSRAISDPSKVSPATLARIREAIRITGFVPNALAGALASRKSRLVSALVPSITNLVYAAMIKSFNDGMRARGYQILLSETGFDPLDEEALISTHLSRRPDAILLTGIHHSAQSRQMLLAAGIPVVEFWDITATPIDRCVGFSHVEAGRAVADFAIAAGYLRAGTISAGDERARRRRTAFVEPFEAHGRMSVALCEYDGPARQAGGRQGLARLLASGGVEGGLVFCSSDLLAHGVSVEAQVRGLSLPRDLAVVGFGDQDFAAHLAPSLTTVRVDREALGLRAAEALLDRLEGAGAMAPVTDLGFEMIRRDSA